MAKSLYELSLEQELERERQERRMEQQFYELENDKRKNDELLEQMSKINAQQGEDTQENKQPVEVPPQQPQQSKEPPEVISSIEGLSKYLGCSKSQAFKIVDSGVFEEAAKDIPIQYMVGNIWKFNRSELDKFLVKHPDFLKRLKNKKKC